MEHEKRKKKQLRKKMVITLFIIPIFIIIALTLIFYAFGWRFDFHDKKLYLSSVLYINTQPMEAQVYLDNQAIGQTKIARQEVKPGDYNLKIVKDDFLPWERIVTVPAYSVVEVDPYLFYQNPQVQKEIKIQKFLATHNQTIIFMTNSIATYCDLPCDKTKEIASVPPNFINTFLTNNEVYFEYSDFYIAYNLNSQNSQKLLKQKDAEVQKTVFSDRGIYILKSDNNLYQLTSQDSTLIQEKVKDITANSDWLFYLTTSGSLIARQDQNKTISQNTITTTNFTDNQIQLSATNLISYNDNIFLKQNNNYFLLTNNQAQYISADLKNYVSLDGYAAWMTDDGELYFKNPENQSPKFINRYFQNPESILFFSPEYLILQYRDEIKIIEVSTKQEFIILKPGQSLNYVYPGSETLLSLIDQNSIKNYKITEGATFWQKILKIFRR